MKKQTLDLSTLKGTIDNVKLINTDEIQKTIKKFLKDPQTEEIANEYLNMMSDVSKKLNEYDVSEEDKNKFRMVFITMFGAFCERDCYSSLLSKTYQSNKSYTDMIKNLQDLYQKERDSYNELAKKYKEQEKDEKVSVPAFQISITTKPNKKLTVDECLALNKEMDLNTVELQESFKRLSVPATHKNKVSRVYVKSSDANQTFQKETKPKLKM